MMVIPVVMFVALDIRLALAPVYLYGRLVMRISIVVAGAWAVRALRRSPDRAAFESVVFVWTVASLALTFAIQCLQAPGATMRIRVPLLYLMAVYASLPNRGLRQIAPPIVFVIGLVLLRLFWLDGGGASDIASDTLVLTLSVALGTLLLRRRQQLDHDAAASLAAEHEARRSLDESEERTRQIIDTSLDAVVTFDGSGRLSGWNPQAEMIFGWTADEALGRDLFTLICPPAFESAAEEELWQSLRRAERTVLNRRLETSATRRDRRVLRVEWSVASVTIQGQRQYSAFVRDISERKRAEAERLAMQEQLTQTSKMESVGRLAGGVAHDFNNMLGVILGTAELAMSSLEPTHPVQADLMEIRKAATRSSELTSQLLAFARRQTVVPKVIDLNTTVDSAMKMLQRLVREDIELRWTPGRAIWNVRIDPLQVDQILANLAGNARDAITGAGRVAIETQNIVVDVAEASGNADARPGEYVVLSVTDSGSGMDPETQSHIFEPFFTTKALGLGTGLGLPMIYGIVRQNDGFVSVQSAAGEGTTIRIAFPRHHGPLDQVAAEGVSAAVAGAETVLVVEDEPALLALSTAILRRSGYSVLVAATPLDAVRIEREHDGPIHLLLTDVVMPEMSGNELATALMARRPQLQTLFMSGYSANMIAHDGVLGSGQHFIQKPFSVKELTAKLRSILQHD